MKKRLCVCVYPLILVRKNKACQQQRSLSFALSAAANQIPKATVLMHPRV